MEKVLLGYNGFTDVGLTEILIGVRNSENITKLEYVGNIIEESSLLEFINIIGKSNFQELALKKIKISNTHFNTFMKVLSMNPKLQKLSLFSLAFDAFSS